MAPRGALAGFGATVVVCMFWRLFMHDESRHTIRPPVRHRRRITCATSSATIFLVAWVPLFASFAALLVYHPRKAPRGCSA